MFRPTKPLTARVYAFVNAAVVLLVLLGVFIVTSIMVIAFNLLTDLVYTLVDPRIEPNA